MHVLSSIAAYRPSMTAVVGLLPGDQPFFFKSHHIS